MPTTARKLILATLAALGLLAAGTLGAVADGYLSPADKENPIAIRGCVIRFDDLSDTGNSVIPRIHANSTHQCVGVEEVRADWSTGPDRGKLVVTHGDGLGTVVFAGAFSDETLAEKGITCGGSGGGAVTKFSCYDRDGVFVPAWSTEMYSPTANLWLAFSMWDA